MKSNLWIWSCLLVLPLALAAAGCSDDSGLNCPVGQTDCNGVCKLTASDRDNCGVCDNACLDGQYCAAGQCVACQNECNVGQTQCAPGTNNQVQACGDPDLDTCLEWAVPVTCGAGQVCQAGACVTSCTDECSREDAQACDVVGANGYRICGNTDADDCLEWGDLVPCGVGTTCVDGDCIDACVDECQTDGQRVCAAPPDNGFLICGNHDADACLELGALTLCPQGETCSVGVCSSDCVDDCTAGQRTCDGNGYRTCGSFDPDPCRDWSGVTNCAGYELCANGVCEIACQDDCDAGTRRCPIGANGFEVCANYDADPCLEWGNLTPCGGGETCVNGNCIEDCSDECPGVGQTICDGNGYRTCRTDVDADSCREWSGITDCTGGQTCVAGVCSDVCITQCSDGERECSGNGWHACIAVPDPQNPGLDCWVWGPTTACQPYYACNPATATCQLTCSDDCQAGGAQRCSGDLTGYQVCAANWDPDPCLEWGAAVACQQYYECDPGSSQCVLACSNECQTAGNRRCANGGAGYEECGEWDGDPCLEWGSYLDCPANQTCSSGVCALSCTDECASVGTVVCDAGDPTLKAYSICGNYDADACLELGTPASCSYGQQCQAGSGCVTVCTDSCPAAGRVQCNGLTVEICAAGHDSDECLEWGSQTSCNPASQLCYLGACVANTPPSTVLVNEVLYDNVGVDTQAGNFLFIELWGVGGQSLNNYSIVGVNGAAGQPADYVTIRLDGYSIPADGHFVVAHPAGDAGLLAVADLQTNSVDLQNGPDSVQVRWAGSVVVDALGYDTFAAGDRWAGEGADYTHAAPDAIPVGQVNYCLSRGADHADTNDNAADFYRRTLNNCSPGWEGPGAILWEMQRYGGTSTPAVSGGGHIWTVDQDGWINVAYPDGSGGKYFLPSGMTFLSSVAIDYMSPVDAPKLYVGSDAGVYAYTGSMPAGAPASAAITPIAGWPVVTGYPVASTPAVSGTGAVFFGTRGDGFYGRNPNGSLRFRVATTGWVDSSPALGFLPTGEEVVAFGVGGVGAGAVMVVCANATGTAPCVNAGDVVWQQATGGGCNSSPAIAGGMVLVGCDNGGLFAFNIRTGTLMPDWGIDVSNGGATKFVDACSPVIIPDGGGGWLISMTSRSEAGDFYLLTYDGSTLDGSAWDFDQLASSPAYGADGSVSVHMGPWLLNYGSDGSLQWYAIVGEDFPADAWAHPSPTWVPAGGGLGIIYVVDPFDDLSGGGYLYAVAATAEPGAFPDSYPMFHGDWFNSGEGWGP